MKKIKNKILLATPHFYPYIGGLENYALNMAKGMQKTHGWEVVVVTSSTEKSIKVENVLGIKVYRLPTLFKISNTPVNPLWFFQLQKIIEKEKPDIINGHTPVPFMADVAAIVAKIKNIPFFLTYQNDLEKNNKLLMLLFKIYYKTLGEFVFKVSSKIIVTSKYYARKSIYLKKHIDKLAVIPPGVDTKKFHPGLKPKFLKKEDIHTKVVLFVAQLDRTHAHKGLSYLLEAISLVNLRPNTVKLVVVGKGNNLNEYKNQAKKLGISNSVIFSGFVENKELPSYYCASDLVVLPSYSKAEGFGMVLLEAAACAKPTVGTNIGGIPFVIDNNKTGLLVEPRNPIMLSKAILNLALDPKIAKTMGRNGYEKVINSYTWAQQEEKFFFLARNSIRTKVHVSVAKVFALGTTVGKVGGTQ